MIADEQNEQHEMDVDANKDAAQQFKLLARMEVLQCLTDNEIKSIVTSLCNESTSRRHPPGRVKNIKLMIKTDYTEQIDHAPTTSL